MSVPKRGNTREGALLKAPPGFYLQKAIANNVFYYTSYQAMIQL
jgi:hypothetical protein